MTISVLTSIAIYLPILPAQAQPQADALCGEISNTYQLLDTKKGTCSLDGLGSQKFSEGQCQQSFTHSSCTQSTVDLLRAYVTDLNSCFDGLPTCVAGEEGTYNQDHIKRCFRDTASRRRPSPAQVQCLAMSGMLPFYGAASSQNSRNPEPTYQARAPKAKTPPRARRATQTRTAESDGSQAFISQPNAGPNRSLHVSPMLQLAGFGAFTLGFGGLVGIPIVKNGFIPSINDAFYIEAGGFSNFVFFDSVNVGFVEVGGTQTLLQTLVGARWDFHFTKQLSAYGALRSGAVIALDNGGGGFYFGPAFGGHWRFMPNLALRAEFFSGTSAGSGLGTGITLFF